MKSPDELEYERAQHEHRGSKRCDMCERLALHKYVCKDGNVLDVCGVCYTVVSTSEEVEKLKAWWLKTHNGLRKAHQLEIGVRNNKIKELAGKHERVVRLLETAEGKIDHINKKENAHDIWLRRLEQRIETLEIQHDGMKDKLKHYTRSPQEGI